MLRADIINLEINGEQKRGVFVQTKDNVDLEIIKWGLNEVLDARQKFVDRLRGVDSEQILTATPTTPTPEGDSACIVENKGSRA